MSVLLVRNGVRKSWEAEKLKQLVKQGWKHVEDVSIREHLIEAASQCEDTLPPAEVDLERLPSKEGELAALKAKADELGIKYHHKAGVATLTELLNGAE